MSRRGGADRVVEAVHGRMRRHFELHDRPLEAAVVRKAATASDPMLVELLDSHLKLEEGTDFHLSQLLRWYDANYSIQADDVLLLMRLREVLWVAFDVRTNLPITAGVRPSKPPAAPGRGLPFADADLSGDITYVGTGSDPQGGVVDVTITQNHHIVRKLPYYDKDGVRVGWTAIYGDLP